MRDSHACRRKKFGELIRKYNLRMSYYEPNKQKLFQYLRSEFFMTIITEINTIFYTFCRYLQPMWMIHIGI